MPPVSNQPVASAVAAAGQPDVLRLGCIVSVLIRSFDQMIGGSEGGEQFIAPRVHGTMIRRPPQEFAGLTRNGDVVEIRLRRKSTNERQNEPRGKCRLLKVGGRFNRRMVARADDKIQGFQR